MTRARKRDQDLPAGISRVHDAGKCPAHASGDVADCTCRPQYQAQAGPKTSRKTKTHRTKSAAVAWKRDIEDAFKRGDHLRPTMPTVAQVVEAWLDKAARGVVLTRSRRPYRQSTLRAYRQAYESLLHQELGDVAVDQLKRGRLNELAQDLQARGMAEQTVRNAFIPLRAVLRDQVDLEKLDANVSRGMVVPSGSGRRTRTIAPELIDRYLRAVHEHDRPLWATLIFTGLRRGEAMALRWSDVDLGSGYLAVRLSYDPATRVTGPVKSVAGQDRKVPIPAALREQLVAHRQRAGTRPTGLVFPRESLHHHRVLTRHLGGPFSDTSVAQRAARAWNAEGLPPVTMHECRHTYASLLIAAWAASGTFDPKALQELLGHASIQQTYDRYGHLFPGARAAAGRLLDAYIGNAGDRAATARAAADRLIVTLEDADARDVVDVARQTSETISEWLRAAEEAIKHADSSSAACSGAVSVQRPGLPRTS